MMEFQEPRKPKRLASALLLACLSACQEAAGPPVPFRLGQTIPLESWTLRVRQPEVVSPKLLAGFHDFRISNAKAKVVAVHLNLEPRNSAVAEDPHAAERGFLKLFADCRLKDREGKEYPMGFPVPNSQFRLMKSGGTMSESEMKDYFFSGPEPRLPKDWVLLYAVPQDRSGFTMLIRNREPLEGQPRIASVDLGR